MDIILKSHEYFISEKSDDGSIIVTILKDDNKFYGISLVGCKFITNKMGFTNDKFTEDVIIKIKEVSNKLNLDELDLKCELRNRALNVIMSFL